MQIDLSKHSLEEVTEYIASMVGDKFMKCIALAQDIAENPSLYTSQKALTEAKKLAAWRVELSPMESFYKLKSPATKSPSDRLIKDSIITLLDTTLELINCLKLVSRV